VGFYYKIGWEIIDAHRPNPLMAKLLYRLCGRLPTVRC
jgi:hypothetical protein